MALIKIKNVCLKRRCKGNENVSIMQEKEQKSFFSAEKFSRREGRGLKADG